MALLGVPSIASAQAPTPQESEAEADEDEGIVVTAQRQRGAVTGDIKPELQLAPADIRALGVSTVTELLSELAPQLRSGRGDGQPVVLLEGRRISGFREVRTLPAEAIARVDILPEEVALKYGYPADQKVVNIVLRQRFRAFTAELEDRLATGGGANNVEGSFDFLRIQRAGRLNLHFERAKTDQLLESQRGIDDASGSGRYRTLLPTTETSTLSATLNRSVFNDVSATLNGELSTEESRSLFGRPSASLTLANGGLVDRTFTELSPLTRRNGAQAAHAGATLNGTLSNWRWTFTGNYDHSDSKTIVNRGIDPSLFQAAVLAGQADGLGPIPSQLLTLRPDDIARSQSNLGAIDFTVSGAPFRLPAGDVSTTLKAGASFSGFTSNSFRSGVAQRGNVSRSVADGQISIDLPLASRRSGVLAAVGDLSVNANFAVRRLSDYGTLTSSGGGVTWAPIGALNLISSFTSEDSAPTAQQLGNPVISTPGVRVFDFVRNEPAFVTLVTGGNPNLAPSKRDVWKLGGTLKPFTADITLTVDYTKTKSSGGISALPPASSASQLAFPNRYVRDANGFLISVDSRTVNFANSDNSQVRWGLNFSKPLKNSQAQVDALRAAFQARFPNGRPDRGAGDRPAGDRPRGEGARGSGRGGGFGGAGGGGRLNFAIYHTVHLTDLVALRDGLPPIDLLRGGTIGNGGQPRHELELQAGISKNGFGARLTGNWQSATRVTGATAADDLRFSGLATANLRLFVNLAQLPGVIGKAPWLAGTRVTLGVNNLLDSRQRVTDATGATPINYLPGYLDPLGRSVRISIRKLLF